MICGYQTNKVLAENCVRDGGALNCVTWNIKTAEPIDDLPE